jgi:aspartate aminotransferase
MVAERVRRLGHSPTLRISALAKELREAGEDVLDFSAGQPDFATPDVVKEAGKRAIDENRTRYTPNEGETKLRDAVAETIQRHHGLSYAREQILVSSGAKASLYFAFMALLDPGDEIIVPTPYWVSYPEQARLAQAVPVFVTAREESGFKIRAEDLEAAITDRTRALVLNYPSNPTGACYGAEELRPLAELCVRRDLWVIADEIYSRLIFDGRTFTSIAQLDEEIRARTVMINGVSKTYSMTGWRIGWSAGPREIISAMSKIQSHSTSNAASISQWAALEALRSSDDDVSLRVAEFQERRNEIVRLLQGMQGIRCVVPEGSFYAFPNVSSLFDQRDGEKRLRTGADVARYLLDKAKVALVPGDAFGSPQHVRISFAVSLDRIREGVRRIGEALSTLS